MTTLLKNGTFTDLLEAGKKVTVVVNSGGSALFKRSRGDEVIENVTIASGITRVFGEYFVDQSYRVDCLAGSVEITESQSTDAVKPFVVDDSGNVTGLKGPDDSVISGTAPAYTWAGKPAAAAGNAGSIIRITNIGRSGVGTLWVSDGARWLPLTGSAVIARNAIPVILPSSGSIGNNGGLTLTTALPATYAACYMYFPANAISAGSAAGVYYVEMSTTTAGVIYNNTYTSGDPTIPTSKTAFVTTGPGAYTQTTGSDISLLSFSVPGGALGLYGGLRYSYTGQYNNSAGAKTFKCKYGTYAAHSLAPTTSVIVAVKAELVNSGSASVQRSLTNDALSGFSVGSTTAINAAGAIDSTAAQTAALTGQLATATDFLILTAASIEITN